MYVLEPELPLKYRGIVNVDTMVLHRCRRQVSWLKEARQKRKRHLNKREIFTIRETTE